MSPKGRIPSRQTDIAASRPGRVQFLAGIELNALAAQALGDENDLFKLRNRLDHALSNHPVGSAFDVRSRRQRRQTVRCAEMRISRHLIGRSSRFRQQALFHHQGTELFRIAFNGLSRIGERRAEGGCRLRCDSGLAEGNHRERLSERTVIQSALPPFDSTRLQRGSGNSAVSILPARSSWRRMGICRTSTRFMADGGSPSSLPCGQAGNR